MAGSDDGIWDWDLGSDRIELSPRCHEMLGRSGVPYMVGGTYAFQYYAGIARTTKALPGPLPAFAGAFFSNAARYARSHAGLPPIPGLVPMRPALARDSSMVERA